MSGQKEDKVARDKFPVCGTFIGKNYSYRSFLIFTCDGQLYRFNAEPPTSNSFEDSSMTRDVAR